LVEVLVGCAGNLPSKGLFVRFVLGGMMRRFEFIQGTSNKFWEISIQATEVTIRFGRIGTSGTVQTKSFVDVTQTEAEAAKLIRQKTGKGYIEVVAGTDPAPAVNAAAGHKSPDDGQDLSAIEIWSMRELLEDAAGEYSEHSCNDYTVPATEDNRQIIAAAIEFGYRDSEEPSEDRLEAKADPANGTIFIWDHWLMSYLAHRCRTVYSAAELGLMSDLFDYLAENDYHFYDDGEGDEEFTLSPTAENKAFLAAAIKHGSRPGWEAKVKEVENAQEGVAAYSVDVLRWLAVRCRAARGRLSRTVERPQTRTTEEKTRAAGVVPSAQRAGVYERFPKVKNYVKKHTIGPIGWEEHGDSKEIALLQRYCQEPGFAYSSWFNTTELKFNKTLRLVASDIQRIAIIHRWYAIQRALTGKDNWFEWWRRANSYDYWALRIGCMGTKSQYERFLLKDVPQVRPMFLARLGASIGNCLSQGWTEWAIDLARLSWEAMNTDPGILFNDASNRFGYRRTQHFVLRLIADWQGWPVGPKVPTCSVDEPVFQALLAQWRTPDVDVLAPLLLAACDRHTHQARYDSGSKCYDLSEDDWWYDPFEIHSVLRLRLRLGLSNPVLDHPLLSTPLGVLPPETPPYCDGLLAAVLTQGRREMPNLPTLDWPGAPQVDPDSLQPGSLPPVLLPQWKLELAH
jgi:predicted DNA-binding WGR domain protein